MMNQTNYLIVGDVHSTAPAYFAAVNYANKHRLRLVFLGDLFDYRGDRPQDSNAAAIFEHILASNALLVRSNHQERLRKYCAGNTGTIEKSASTKATVADLDRTYGKGNWERRMDYLSTARSAYTLRLNNKYCLAHAFYPEQALVNPALNRKQKQLAIYGPRDPGLPWWLLEHKDLPGDFVRVAGHWHQLYIDSKSIILDGGCGSAFGRLFGFNTETERVELLWAEPVDS